GLYACTLHPDRCPHNVRSLSSTSLLYSYTLQPPPTSPLFPYTTLFRSDLGDLVDVRHEPADVLPRGVAVHLNFVLDRGGDGGVRSEEHTSELQSLRHLVCRLLLEKKIKIIGTCHEIRVHHQYSTLVGLT